MSARPFLSVLLIAACAGSTAFADEKNLEIEDGPPMSFIPLVITGCVDGRVTTASYGLRQGRLVAEGADGRTALKLVMQALKNETGCVFPANTDVGGLCECPRS